MALTRDEIIAAIAARKAEVDTVPVPEWGGDVFIRRLDANDLEATGLLDGGSGANAAKMAVQLMIICVAAEDGTPLFTEDDRDLLAGAEFPIVLRVFAEVAKINGLSNEELEEAMAAFAAAQPDASVSS
jgi:hypothetical protein